MARWHRQAGTTGDWYGVWVVLRVVELFTIAAEGLQVMPRYVLVLTAADRPASVLHRRTLLSCGSHSFSSYSLHQ